MHACKLLKAYYNEEGIKALILDGKEMRTTGKLLNLNNKLKKLIIVEFNKNTYYDILEKIKLYENIKCFNGHIDDYIEKNNDPEINLVYFDLMENFFSSESSHGSDYPINQFLFKTKVNEIILAATFCLRNTNNTDFDTEVEKILIELDLIFRSHLFKYECLLNKKDMRYRGQRGPNKALMFVIFYLKKDNNDNLKMREQDKFSSFNSFN